MIRNASIEKLFNGYILRIEQEGTDGVMYKSERVFEKERTLNGEVALLCRVLNEVANHFHAEDDETTTVKLDISLIGEE